MKFTQHGNTTRQPRTPARPDWREWKHTPKVKAWQAVSLSLNLDPWSLKQDFDLAFGHSLGFSKYSFPSQQIHSEFELRRRVLAANTSPLQDMIALAEFSAWAQSKGWDIPPELAALASMYVKVSAPGAKVEAAPGAKVEAAPGAKVEAAPVKSKSTPATSAAYWKDEARAIADELFDRDTENGCRDSLNGYSSRVMEAMQERGVKGPRGIIDNANTVKRDALQGKQWWANKSK